jgi:hypothetical protein
MLARRAEIARKRLASPFFGKDSRALFLSPFSCHAARRKGPRTFLVYASSRARMSAPTTIETLRSRAHKMAGPSSVNLYFSQSSLGGNLVFRGSGQIS